MKINKFLFKNILDFLIAMFFLIILTPLFIIIALLIKISSPGPIFFKQKRVGKNEKVFEIYKFRTMIEGAENLGLGINVKKNDSRITKIGKILRISSIDELPELFNVIKGEMSLIGPRPMLKVQAEKCNDSQKKRFKLKPGLTGWAQINGRNVIPWEKRIKYDLWYIENWSISLDIKILLKTPAVILSKNGIYGKNGLNDPFI